MNNKEDAIKIKKLLGLNGDESDKSGYYNVSDVLIALMPDYYNQSKPKPDKEEILTERKCYMCGVKAKMGKFERYCSVHCRNRATHMDVNAHGIKFR